MRGQSRPVNQRTSKLLNGLEAAYLELDNGACERAFKPVAIGRRNWLFAGSDKGGADGGDLDEPVHDPCKDLGINAKATSAM